MERESVEAAPSRGSRIGQTFVVFRDTFLKWLHQVAAKSVGLFRLRIRLSSQQNMSDMSFWLDCGVGWVGLSR